MAAFYNVENLFDTINDPTINDEEFLPGSKLDWNTEKY
ncbi:MAG: endonuclease/exonuclease/phosphatase family protein, partial [Bacteroidales bacterium]|nr:endonuclease/exonuclease/phosphatase family protein [Bacteroidales bacterium]